MAAQAHGPQSCSWRKSRFRMRCVRKLLASTSRWSLFRRMTCSCSSAKHVTGFKNGSGEHSDGHSLEWGTCDGISADEAEMPCFLKEGVHGVVRFSAVDMLLILQ